MPLELLGISYTPSYTQFQTFCLTSATRHNRNSLQQTVRTAEKIPLPSMGVAPGSGQATLFRLLTWYTTSFLWLPLLSPACKKIQMPQFIFSGTEVSIDLEECNFKFWTSSTAVMSSDAERSDPQTSPCHLNSHTNPILTSGDYLHHWSWQHTHSHISACNIGQSKMWHLGGGCEWEYSRDHQAGVSRNHYTLISISYQGCWKATSPAVGCTGVSVTFKGITVCCHFKRKIRTLLKYILLQPFNPLRIDGWRFTKNV